MNRAYKVEINPTEKQINKINQTIGVARFIYNFYIAHNKKIYQTEGKFISGMSFEKWLNNEYLPNNPDMKWIKRVSTKSTKKAIMNADKAFRDFFNKNKGFPRFKKKKNQDIKAYFPKNNKTDWIIERHRVKIPTLGWVRLKEFGYIPTNSIVKSGAVSRKCDRYFVSILVEEIIKDKDEDSEEITKEFSEGIGLDLGIKDFAVCSNNKVYKNINKSHKVKKLEKRLKRKQRKLSRKYESLKLRNKKEKGEATRQNIIKQIAKVQKIHHKLSNIRTDYINKTVFSIVYRKPKYITIEDLNIKGMVKNKHLSKAVASQKFYEFKNKLIYKCTQNDIELRIVDRWYPSSKLCSQCGKIKKDLKLKDRVYKCSCGLAINRDLNASINLKNAEKYKIA